jgi:CBS domain-containing protein
MTRSVAEIMTTQLVTFLPETNIHKAIKVLLEKRLSGAPIVDDTGELVDVLSKKDCLKVVFSTGYHQNRGGMVREYMSPEVTTIDADTDLVSAAETFLDSNYRRFPVLRESRLVGQISRCDILRSLIEEA